MKLFHGTASKFESFSLEFAAREDMNGNGNLGIWLATEAKTAAHFGPHCLEIEAPFRQVFVMDISTLSNLNRQCNQAIQAACIDRDQDARAYEREFYTSRRNSLAEQGYDAIALREIDGEIAMYVALEPEVLSILECHPSADILCDRNNTASPRP